MAKYKAGDIVYYADINALSKTRNYNPIGILGHKILILNIKLEIRKKFTSYNCICLDLNTGENIKMTIHSNDPYISREE